jgi:hypothetical protein
MPLIRPETRECIGKMLTTTLSPAELEPLNRIAMKKSSKEKDLELLEVIGFEIQCIVTYNNVIL